MPEITARMETPHRSEEWITEEDAHAFMVRFLALLRTTRTHESTNEAFRRPVRELMGLLRGWFEESEEILLVARSGHLYIGPTRVRVRSSMLSAQRALMEELKTRGLSGIRFHREIEEEGLVQFVGLLESAQGDEAASRFAAAWEKDEVPGICPVPGSPGDSARNERPGERERARRLFEHAIAGTRRILIKAQETGRPDLRQAKRLVQPVVDTILQHEYSIVGLTALKSHDSYTCAHSLNVSILAVGMGQAVGLPRQALADLGVAALLHDIGKVAIPGEILRKPGTLTPEEWDLIRRHPIEGVRALSRIQGLSALALDAMRVCLEHHMNVDATGYPPIRGGWRQSTASRITAVADFFDAVTAHRAYRPRPWSPFEALTFLMGPMQQIFDPAVRWALVRTVGLYPAGTVLRTRSGHVVLAIAPNGGDPRRPTCQLVLRPDGSIAPEEDPEIWDPMPPEEQVVAVVPPEECGIDTSERLAA